MSVVFQTEGHKYTSIDVFDETKWISASKLAGLFKPPFDEKKASEKASKNSKSKWYKIDPVEIISIWKAENLRSTTLGTWYHDKQEQEWNGLNEVDYDGKMLPIIRSVWQDDKKIAPAQKLEEGIYTEHLAYVQSAGVCGQFDRIARIDEFVDIDDYKSNKDLKKPAYVKWDGASEKMLAPLLHLENCKLVEYGLQLSIGMYMVIRHNPHLKPRNLTLHHVTFELEGENSFGYPILRLDTNNEPIVKGVEKISLPYMKREVEIMFDWWKNKNV